VAEEMKLNFEKITDSRIKFEMKVLPELVEKSKQMALREMGGNMELGGFRKGKAPTAVLEDNIEKDKLIIETVDIAVKEAYYDVVMKNKDEFSTIGTPKIEFTSKVDGDIYQNGFSVFVEVDIYPEIVLPDLDKLKVAKDDVHVSKDDVQNTIDDVRKKRSKLEAVEDGHMVEKGDWVDVDFEVTVDNKVEEELGSKAFPLVVGNNSMIPGFEDKLIGVSKDKEVEFDLEIGADFRDNRLAGKNPHFKVKINDVKKLSMPELNDDFIKELKIEGIEDVNSFEKYLEESLTKEKEFQAEEQLKNKIIDVIEKEVELSVPVSLQEREIHMMWHEFEDNLKRRNIDTADYLQKEGLDKEKIQEGWKDQADKRAKVAMVIGEIVKKLEISVDKEELNDYIKHELIRVEESLKSNYPDNFQEQLEMYKKEYQNEERRRYFEQHIMINKMFDILKEKMI